VVGWACRTPTDASWGVLGGLLGIWASVRAITATEGSWDVRHRRGSTATSRVMLRGGLNDPRLLMERARGVKFRLERGHGSLLEVVVTLKVHPIDQETISTLKIVESMVL
jgi:hypothetical protein